MATTERTDHRLSAQELEQFERDGFIGPIKIYEPEEMEERWNTIRRQLPDRSLAIYPDDALGAVTNISNYDRHLDVDLLSEHIMKAEIVDRVASILGPDVLCWRTEFFPKYPGDEGTDWHQAATFANASKKPQILWPSRDGQPAFGGTITVWTAFTDSTRENGCLQLMPGTHRQMNYDESKPMEYDPEAINAREKEGVKRGFFGYDYRQLQKDPNWQPDESQAFPLVMKRGECVIFWSTLMHASLPHTGSKKDYRMGFAARYVPTQVRIYPDTDTVAEYGGGIPLDNYGAVLVSGKDEYGHNRIAKTSRRGFTFEPRGF
ncbi:chlorinating enzyme [Streptomyces sp. TRM43335]|uniref:Chlorinating enzyme n=1 Tax=Streptomyces taklimakanensis TaxID=2569853 RepID=A0A6G2BBK5_9ACTN|nr:chlorinating enzyme [Streptomyces taklimakanensis]MTE19604.1 chlorinating enzyme [Streptomyces taklimakanensis]